MKNNTLRKRLLTLGMAAVLMSSTISGICPMNVQAEEMTETVEEEETPEIQELPVEETEEPESEEEPETEEEPEIEKEPETVEEAEAEEERDAEEEPELEESESEETEEPEIPEREEATEPAELEVPAETQEPVYTENELQTGTLEESMTEELPSNEDLFAGYVEQAMYGEDGIALYANYGEQSLSGIDRAVYRCLKRRVQEVAAGNRASTKFEISYTELEQEGGSSDQVTYVSMYRVLEVLMRDCPYELYWFDTTKSFTYGGWGNFQVHLQVSADYQNGDSYTVNSAKLGTVRTAVAKAKQIVSECSGLGDYEKLQAYKNRICDLTSYNYLAANTNQAYGDPWQLIYVFDGDQETKVVCEGYAKAFQYLCDLSSFRSNIICYTMTGGMNGQGHMWNIVHMNDGKNYLVDVTNCDDMPEQYSNILFLAGTSNGSRSSGYTFHLWSDLTYTYDNSNGLYGDDVLVLASESYDPQKSSSSGSSGNQGNTGSSGDQGTSTGSGDSGSSGNSSALSQPGNIEQPSTPSQPGNQPTQEEFQDTLNVTVTGLKTQTYTGKEIKPKITVKDGTTGKKLKAGKQYTLSYENNVNAGTGMIVIHGVGAYSGEKHVLFTIQPQNIAKKVRAKVVGKRFLYTGAELTPPVSLVYNKRTLAEGSDYHLSYANNVAKGNAQITITGTGNYTGTKVIKFKITGPKIKDTQVTLTPGTSPLDYPQVTVTYQGKTCQEGVDYIVKYPTVMKTGKNKIQIRGIGNFSGSVSRMYEGHL